MKRNKQRDKQRRKQFFILLSVILIALVGTLLILVIHAANSAGSIETENGTLAGQAKTINDAAASGGKAVAFIPPTTGCGADSGFTPAGMRAIPCVIYGVTVDRVDNLSAIIASSDAFQHMPTTRIVFDPNKNGPDYGSTQYQTAITQLKPHSYLMGELLDSSEESNMPIDTEKLRVAKFVSSFKNDIDIWEVGNEVNGNWTGPYQSVADKIVARYNIVKNEGKRTALTLWENTYAPNHCGNGNSELTGVQFSNQYVPASVRNGLNYVFLSWYPSQCTGLTNDNVPAATIKAEVQELHALYPNALIGFGEIGMPKPAVTNNADNTTRLQAMVDYYYSLSPKINLPYYVGAYFYWYYWEDALPHTTKPIWQNLNNGFGQY